jgi:hypothetical protein
MPSAQEWRVGFARALRSATVPAVLAEEPRPRFGICAAIGAVNPARATHAVPVFAGLYRLWCARMTARQGF